MLPTSTSRTCAAQPIRSAGRARTVDRDEHYRIASGLFRFAVKGGLAERNPVRDLTDDRPCSARHGAAFLTRAEIQRLLENLSDT